ncbi:MAG: hypothetical protein LBU53_14010 [Zoogloeaceae bacterium]|jgi:hypothetical protein|nr:hypothetical protein [Zoogloeaceae bacterium]
MCNEVGKYPGAAVNFAMMNEPSMPGDDITQLKIDFINILAGPPDAEIPKEMGKTVSGQAYGYKKSIKDAITSPALTFLKELQIDYSGTGSDEASGLPPALAFQKIVKTYFGNTQEYVDWSKKLAAQEERGIMIEILQQKAVQLNLRAKEDRQQEQQEVILASLLANQIQAQADLDANTKGAAAIANEIRKKMNEALNKSANKAATPP